MVTGTYDPPSLDAAYWLLRAPTYFQLEEASDIKTIPNLDALFTSRATMTNVPFSLQGTTVIDDSLATARLRVGEVAALRRGIRRSSPVPTSPARTSSSSPPPTRRWPRSKPGGAPWPFPSP